MSLRLAGAGSQIGMSEGDILGFAAALSSVGVEAEAGGSAFSKVMVQMQLATEKGMGSFDELIAIGEKTGVSFDQMVNAIDKGGKPLKAVAGQMGLTNKQLRSMYKEADKSAMSLQNFSEVAGMTNAEFANLFKKDPSKAIMAFVKGLADAESQGKSAIAVLDDMDIKEVRLRDSLLRAANASGIFSEAVETGNKAFGENTALAEEAGKRYETTESKLKMLKNEAVDAAIDMGGPFVDALRSGLEASKPLIKSLGETAKAFSDMEPEQQKNIVKWAGIALATGPVIKGFSNVITVGGKTVGMMGSLSQGVGKLVGKAAEKAALEGMATSIGAVGAASATAGGMSGVGGFVTAMASVAPVATGLVGAGGVLAVGYGVWKLWGEEVWEASQRTKRWGTDVGEATDEALTKFQGYSRNASGELELMAQGLNGSTENITDNFMKMGQSIEKEMNNRISNLKEMVKTLPDDVREAGEKLAKEEEEKIEKSLAIVKENNEKIAQIRTTASNEHRQMTYEDTVRIKALTNEMAEAYVTSLGKSEKETKQILNAMTGNVDQASKDQAKSWLQSLGEQREASKNEYRKMIENKKSELTDAGYDLDSQYAKKVLDLIKKSGDSATKITDDQMSVILAKYPELANEVSLANGQIIDETSAAAIVFQNHNKDIMKSFENMATTASKTAEANAKKINILADESTSAGEAWNKIVFDPKTGSVKTNAQAAVNEAAKSQGTWNQLMWMGKSADVSSNVKLMIAEAAIASRRWNKMTFTDQQALIKTNATKEITQALQVKDDWNKMSFEQKKAIVYSNSTEAVAETLTNLGLWDKYKPKMKELKAENYDFLEKINKSEDKLKDWGNVPVEVKKIIGENYDFLNKVYGSEKEFERWKAIPNDTKKMLAKNDDLLIKLFESKSALDGYNKLPTELKRLLADGPAKMTYEETKKALQEYEKIEPKLKHLLGNNDDINSKIDNANSRLNLYELNNPSLKLLQGDSSSVKNAASSGEEGLNKYSRNNPHSKILKGNSGNVIDASNAGDLALNAFARNNPSDKYLNAHDYASSNANEATQSVDNFSRLPSVITKTLKVVGDWLGFEDGTDFHPGGMAMVNDQKGPMYRELVTLPNGASFIPEGRNVFLPLPRGSKVMKASDTRSLFPSYEKGIPFENTGVASLTAKLRVAQDNGKLISKDKEHEYYAANNMSDNSSLIYAINQLQSTITNSSAEQVSILKGLLNKDMIAVFDDVELTRRVNENNAITEFTKLF